MCTAAGSSSEEDSEIAINCTTIPVVFPGQLHPMRDQHIKKLLRALELISCQLLPMELICGHQEIARIQLVDLMQALKGSADPVVVATLERMGVVPDARDFVTGLLNAGIVITMLNARWVTFERLSAKNTPDPAENSVTYADSARLLATWLNRCGSLFQ